MARMSTAVQWLIAGGRVARPGDVSRARHGVRFRALPGPIKAS
jgi:predicted ATPase with chaperone activity